VSGGIGTLVGSGSKAGVEIGATLRMTTGIVESGRADAIGRGATLGIGAALGSETAVGIRARLGIGATSGGSVIAGSAGDVTVAGTEGSGAIVGASGPASGAGAELVQATEAINAMKTSGRIPILPPGERASQRPAGRP
jgi:hypothetical protein